MIPPGESVDEREGKHYKELIKVISWFFFDLLLLGYVEDPITGLSVCISGGMDWKIYVEVPSQIGSGNPKESLANLIEVIPALGIVGEPCPIDQRTKYTIDADVQLVCKYFNAYQTYKENGCGGINQLFNGRDIVKFSTQPDLSHQKCYELLTKSWPKFSEVSKVRQKLFIKYMKRRCAFLDVIPAFNFNTGAGEYYDDPETRQKEVSNTRQLGSTLMETMLKEAEDFCSLVKQNWLNEPHQQLIYEIKDGGGSFGLLSLNPDELPSDDVIKFEKIGVQIPSMDELHQRTTLEDYLSRALNFEVKDIIDQCNYVLTLDYTIKMLNIHERRMCGVPVIIEGETGVGKTALLEMLSNLWTHSLLHELNLRKGRILDFMRRKLQQLAANNSVDMKSIACVGDISAGVPVNEEDLVNVCCLPDATSSTGYFYTTLQSELSSMKQDKSLLLLTAKTKGQKPLSEYFTLYSDKSAQATACLLHAVLTSEVKSTFHKINVHAALTPQQVGRHLHPAIEQARFLMNTPFDGKDKKSLTSIYHCLSG
ncbi:E3 ubiquitin-protein ligase rnf213-alpha [Geodia barretti]|uniref:E3 ubiquitin-protein ligase rnf213-alpha n=1 Tax=Geodia barretti TaxID=519541 RepID=A0AA35TR49_GEOBA|nr:E3 ubiquitin-protein ligase rnf213-alpha [Geodia barretti]